MKKTGFIMLLLVAFLLSIQVAAFGVEPTKDAFCTDSVISENKIVVQGEVADINASSVISENMTAFAVEPIQAEAGFLYTIIPVDADLEAVNYLFDIYNNEKIGHIIFTDSIKYKDIGFLPGGLLNAGLA